MNQPSPVTGATALNAAVDGALGRLQLDVGDSLSDRYRVVAHLGSGGMGEVYEVEHIALGRRFAAKVLRRELSAQPVLVARFGSEVRAMARIHSDYVAHIVDTGSLVNGTPYFVMDLLHGTDLKTLLKRTGRLAPRRAVGLIMDACWGLHAVHAAGLVHRDIKPSNLFVAETDSGSERCLLLDFGVTKSTNTTHTLTGQLIGTPQYMAPEQLDDGVVDSRTDLYSLGAVLYECLVGHAPHRGETLARLVSSILNRAPVPIQTVCPEISGELSKLVMTAMERSGTSRFASARSMADALGRYVGPNRVVDGQAGDTTTAASLWTPIATERSTRKRTLRRIGQVVLFALVGVGMVWIVWSKLRYEQVPPSKSSSALHFDNPSEESPIANATSSDSPKGPSPSSTAAESVPNRSTGKPRANDKDARSSKLTQSHTRRTNSYSAVRAASSGSAIDATNPYAN